MVTSAATLQGLQASPPESTHFDKTLTVLCLRIFLSKFTSSYGGLVSRPALLRSSILVFFQCLLLHKGCFIIWDILSPPVSWRSLRLTTVRRVSIRKLHSQLRYTYVGNRGRRSRHSTPSASDHSYSLRGCDSISISMSII